MISQTIRLRVDLIQNVRDLAVLLRFNVHLIAELIRFRYRVMQQFRVTFLRVSLRHPLSVLLPHCIGSLLLVLVHCQNHCHLS